MSYSTTSEMHVKSKKNVFLENAFYIAGPIVLRALYGMSLTSLETLSIRVKQSYNTANLSVSVNNPTVESIAAADSRNSWIYVQLSLFAGAFLFSLVLFVVSGYFKKTPNAHFKILFTVSSFLICASNLICGAVDNTYMLSVSRFVMGIGTGIACSLGSVYYIALLGPTEGAKVASLQGLVVTLGVLSEGRLSTYLADISLSYIFYVIAAIAFAIGLFNLVYSKNLLENSRISGETEKSKTLPQEPSPRTLTDRSPWLMIFACVLMQVSQQMTGMSPILSSKDKIFTDAIEHKTKYAKAFFDGAGLIGTTISCLIMFGRIEWFRYITILSGLATSSLFLAMIWADPVTICWCAGLYLFLFSMGLATLPGMLPSMLLKEKRNISMAAGLGSLANSFVSCLAIVGYATVYEALPSAVFGVFSFFCFTLGVGGFVLITHANKMQRENNLKAIEEGIPLQQF